MLPGLRFLALATVMATSVLIFGLGAAALWLASHDRFAMMASRNLPHAPLLVVRPVAERPVLSLLRVDTPPKPVERVPLELPIAEAHLEAAEVAVVTPPPQEHETAIVASVPPAPAQDIVTQDIVIPEDAAPALAAPVGPLVTSHAWMEEEQPLAVVSEFSPKPDADVQAHASAPDAAPAAAPVVVVSTDDAVPSALGAADAAGTKTGEAGDAVEETMVALIENPPLPRPRPDFALLERQRQEASRRARLAERRQRAAKLAANQAANQAARQAEIMRAQAERGASPPFAAPSGFGQGSAGGFGQFPQRQVMPPR